jgi:hypothetical protein
LICARYIGQLFSDSKTVHVYDHEHVNVNVNVCVDSLVNVNVDVLVIVDGFYRIRLRSDPFEGPTTVNPPDLPKDTLPMRNSR